MSFARGFIKGFIGQSLDKKAAADEALADLNARVAENYLTNIQPNFIKNEKNIINTLCVGELQFISTKR
mgnify:CR=1 FL=1